MLAVYQLGEIIQGVAVYMVGSNEQDVFDQQRRPALLGECSDVGIAGRFQRHPDALMGEPSEQRHAPFLVFAEYPLEIIQITVLPRLPGRPDSRQFASSKRGGRSYWDDR